jgi:hypothetical protein
MPPRFGLAGMTDGPRAGRGGGKGAVRGERPRGW